MFEEANRGRIFPINMPLQRSHTPCGLVCVLSGNRTQVCEKHRFANRLLKQVTLVAGASNSKEPESMIT